MIPFQRDGDTITASFTTLERQLIGDLAESVAELLGPLASRIDDDPLFAATGIGGSADLHPDPAIARLLPNAHRHDDTASADFRRLTERSLSDRKVTNARAVLESLETESGDVALDAALVQSWLRTLADIRLVIASRLGIEQDDDRGTADTDELVMLRDVYDWLGFVTESLIEALDS